MTQPSEAPLLWPASLNPTPPEPMNEGMDTRPMAEIQGEREAMFGGAR